MQVREVPYRAEHLIELSKRTNHQNLSIEMAREFEREFFSYSGMAGDRVIFCGGFHEYWPGRVESWCVIANDARAEFLALFKMVKKKIESVPFRRIESVIKLDFKEGHRWMRLLGFKKEAEVMRGYGPMGEDFALYARVN